jgi:polyisoprenoid-binding protein YceI
MADTTVQSVPATGVWDADASHSSIEFTARHLMATKVRGRFSEWTATLTTAEAPADSKVEAHIQTASITTFNEGRDNHLRSADFFDAEKYPTIDFVSTSIGELDGKQHFTVTGDLTMHGVTAPVTLDTEFAGVFEDPYGQTKAAFSGRGEINRETWGLTWNQPLQGGGWLVSKTIVVEFDVQFVLRKDAQ